MARRVLLASFWGRPRTAAKIMEQYAHVYEQLGCAPARIEYRTPYQSLLLGERDRRSVHRHAEPYEIVRIRVACCRVPVLPTPHPTDARHVGRECACEEVSRREPRSPRHSSLREVS
jgi:hypothetical protein